MWNELALLGWSFQTIGTGIRQVVTLNIQLPPLEEWINAEHAKLSWPRRLEYNVEVKGSAALIRKKCKEFAGWKIEWTSRTSWETPSPWNNDPATKTLCTWIMHISDSNPRPGNASGIRHPATNEPKSVHMSQENKYISFIRSMCLPNSLSYTDDDDETSGYEEAWTWHGDGNDDREDRAMDAVPPKDPKTHPLKIISEEYYEPQSHISQRSYQGCWCRARLYLSDFSLIDVDWWLSVERWCAKEPRSYETWIAWESRWKDTKMRSDAKLVRLVGGCHSGHFFLWNWLVWLEESLGQNCWHWRYCTAIEVETEQSR